MSERNNFDNFLDSIGESYQVKRAGTMARGCATLIVFGTILLFALVMLWP